MHGYDVVLASLYNRQSDYHEVMVLCVLLPCKNTMSTHSGRPPVSRLMKCCMAKRDTLILRHRSVMSNVLFTRKLRWCNILFTTDFVHFERCIQECHLSCVVQDHSCCKANATTEIKLFTKSRKSQDRAKAQSNVLRFSCQSRVGCRVKWQ